MAGPIGKIGFKVIGLAFAVPSGIAVNKALKAGWRRSRGSDPPQDVKAPENDWLETIAWAGISATVVTGVQVVAARGAAATYRFLTGRHAPGRNPDLADAIATAKNVKTVK